jgi:hypothetical protein
MVSPPSAPLRKKENQMTMSPAGYPAASERCVLEQPLPNIVPMTGLSRPLLRDAMQSMEEPSMAEFVLSLHHEHNKVLVEGLPIGPNEQEVFDFYWDKIAQHDHNAVMLPLYTVFDDAERDVFVTLHTDKSALIWQKLDKDSYAPIPQPFYLDLSQVDLLGLLPCMFEHLGTSRGLSLKGFLAKHWDLDFAGVAVKPFAGDIGLRTALEAEARQWVAWLPQALPVPCVYEEHPPAEREILYPWLQGISPMSAQQKEGLEDLLRDFLRVMALQEDITDATGGLSIMGRRFNRRGELENPLIYIGWGDALANTWELTDAWENLLLGILDHPDCPAPKIAQVSQNKQLRDTRPDNELELYRSTSVLWLTEEIDSTMTSHEIMECMARIAAFGVPIPPKGAAFRSIEAELSI